MELMDLVTRRAIDPELRTSRSTDGAGRPEAGVLNLPSVGEVGRSSGSVRREGANKVYGDSYQTNEVDVGATRKRGKSWSRGSQTPHARISFPAPGPR